MKVSYKWVQSLVAQPLPDVSTVVQQVGAQLGEVDETIALGARYDGAVIVRVVSCRPVPDSDHLNECLVDDAGVTEGVARNEQGYVQVVCGAPNVKAEMLAVWLPPGSVVPSTAADSEPFILGARKLRGVMSNGMLASAKELGIGESHDGIVAITDEPNPGTPFAKFADLDDSIIDIENKMFTHRPDCFGQLGVAREIAGITSQAFSSPDWYVESPEIAFGEGLALHVVNEAPRKSARFMALAFDGVTITESPLWLQASLAKVGLKPINNIVDITNYVMMLTGQPMHAYDYDKVAALTNADGAHVIVRTAREDDSLPLLNGKTITPHADALVIATDSQPIGLAGVMGGGNTEVDAGTTRIILECASFDMYATRKTSMVHGLFTDAVTRYTKGPSPRQLPAAMACAVNLLTTTTAARAASPLFDEGEAIPTPEVVSVTASFIASRLGAKLDADAIAQLLSNVEFDVAVNGDELRITAPFWRTDIAIAEDIVEEVGRLYGYDTLPHVVPSRRLQTAQPDQLLAQKSRIRTSLSGAGANEVLTYSFVPAQLLKAARQNPDQAFTISNALSPELQHYRFNPLPSLLDKVHPNSKTGHDEFALFELGKGHSTQYADDGTGVPTEFEDLDLVYAAKKPRQGAAFYVVRRMLDELATDLGIAVTYQPLDATLTDDPITSVFMPARSAAVYAEGLPDPIGFIGEFAPSVTKAFKLPAYAAGFSLSQTSVLDARDMQSGSTYTPLPKFPSVTQDLTFTVSNNISALQLSTALRAALMSTDIILHIEQTYVYQAESSDSKNVTFRVTFTNAHQTLQTSAVNELVAQAAETLASSLNAQLV